MDTVRYKLGKRLDSLKERYHEAMRGKMIPTPKAANIQREIIAVRQEIEEMDRRAAERLALEKAPLDEVLEIIAIPLLADVMNDIVAGVDRTLRRNGCQETVFGEYTSQIRAAALAMVNTLDTAKDNLPRLLEVDDTLIDAVKKKLMSFIRQRLNIKKS